MEDSGYLLLHDSLELPKYVSQGRGRKEGEALPPFMTLSKKSHKCHFHHIRTHSQVQEKETGFFFFFLNEKRSVKWFVDMFLNYHIWKKEEERTERKALAFCRDRALVVTVTKLNDDGQKQVRSHMHSNVLNYSNLWLSRKDLGFFFFRYLGESHNVSSGKLCSKVEVSKLWPSSQIYPMVCFLCGPWAENDFVFSKRNEEKGRGRERWGKEVEERQQHLR